MMYMFCFNTLESMLTMTHDVSCDFHVRLILTPSGLDVHYCFFKMGGCL